MRRNAPQRKATRMKKPIPKVNKGNVSIRWDLAEWKAVQKAAEAEDLPASHIVRRATREWLRSKGFLK
jgi:hypothetical protein